MGALVVLNLFRQMSGIGVLSLGEYWAPHMMCPTGPEHDTSNGDGGKGIHSIILISKQTTLNKVYNIYPMIGTATQPGRTNSV